MKMLFQKRLIPIPKDRDLAYQIHSIKKTVTASRNLVFDTEKNEKHHADKFWALALAVSAARREWITDDLPFVGTHVFR
jgi:phage FluMu gp28-like protein